MFSFNRQICLAGNKRNADGLIVSSKEQSGLFEPKPRKWDQQVTREANRKSPFVMRDLSAALAKIGDSLDTAISADK